MDCDVRESSSAVCFLPCPLLGIAAPAAALIATQCRPLFDSGTSQVDPFEVAEPESGLRSVPFPILLSPFLAQQKCSQKRFTVLGVYSALGFSHVKTAMPELNLVGELWNTDFDEMEIEMLRQACNVTVPCIDVLALHTRPDMH